MQQKDGGLAINHSLSGVLVSSLLQTDLVFSFSPRSLVEALAILHNQSSTMQQVYAQQAQVGLS